MAFGRASLRFVFTKFILTQEKQMSCVVCSLECRMDSQIHSIHCIVHVICALPLLVCCSRHPDLLTFCFPGGMIVKLRDLSNKWDKSRLLCSGLHARTTNVLKESNEKSCLCFRAHLFKSWKNALFGQFSWIIPLMISRIVFFL